MDAFDAIGLLLPALEKVGDKVVGYDDRIRKKFNRALQTALKGSDEFYIRNVEIHMPELVGLIVLVMDEPSSINTIPLPNYINRDEFRSFYEETKSDKDLCQVLNDEWNQFKAKDTNNIVKKLYQLIAEQTGGIDEVKGLVEKLFGGVEELNEKVGKIVDKEGYKLEISKTDNTNQLYKCLDEKLHDKRENHPSFQLMKIDDRLFPNAQTKQKHIKIEALDSNDKLKTVRNIIEESWGKGEKNHLMIEGDGGIGKTVTLLSIPDTDKIAPHYVPAIYIPLHELTTGEDPIERYIKKKILKNKGDLYEQLLDLVDQPWDNGPRLLLLLDGFNEISAEQRVPIGRDIVYWSDFHGVQIITSSRYDIHTYVALGDKYSALKLQALSDATVVEYLGSMNIPIPTDDAVKKLITTPLLLTLYAMTERVMEERDCDSSDFKEVKSAGSIVWNYLQCELWNFGKEGEDAKNALIAMEFIAPYIAWRMQQKTLFVLNKKEFHDFLEEAYHLLENHFDKTDEFPFQISDAIQKSNGIPPLDLIRSLLENKLCLFVKNGNDYRLMHQQFRDALAAMHLINMSYLSGDSLHQEWNTPVDYYVMQFVADLISKEEATRLWEQNRKTIPAIDDATRNQLRLQGLLHKNDFTHLNFSGLDLSNISLYPYRIDKTTIKLPSKSEMLAATHFSDMSFSPIGHEGEVNSIVVTEDGKHIISSSEDRTIRVWDLETTNPISQPIKGIEETNKIIAVTPNGRRIVSMSNETINVWDSKTGNLIGKPIRVYHDYANAVTISHDGNFIVGGINHTIHSWDLETGKPISKILTKHKDRILAIAATLDGKRVISGSKDSTICVWDLENGDLLEKLEGHTDSVYVVAVTSDGKRIVSGSWDGTIRVWKSETGVPIGKPISGQKDPEYFVAITPDNKRIVSRSRGNVHVWDMETGNLLREPVDGHEDRVNAVAVTLDSKRAVSGSDDRTIRIWNLETGKPIGKPIIGHTGWVKAVAVTPDGKRIVSGSRDMTIRIWDLRTGNPLGEPIEKHKDGVLSVAVSLEGNYIASGCEDGTIRVWNLKTGILKKKPIQAHIDGVHAVAASSNGKLLVSGSGTGIIRIWDMEDGSLKGELVNGYKSKALAVVTMTSDGSRIVSGYDDGTICVWDLMTGKPMVKTIKAHEDRVCAVALTNDGECFVSGSDDRTIRVWDSLTSRLKYDPIEWQVGWVRGITVTSDNKRIISGSGDGIVSVWDLNTGRLVGDHIQVKENKDWAPTVAMTTDGDCMVSGFGNGIISVANLKTNKLRTIKVHPLSFLGLDFSNANISSQELKETLRQNGAKV